METTIAITQTTCPIYRITKVYMKKRICICPKYRTTPLRRNKFRSKKLREHTKRNTAVLIASSRIHLRCLCKRGILKSCSTGKVPEVAPTCRCRSSRRYRRITSFQYPKEWMIMVNIDLLMYKVNKFGKLVTS